MAQENADAIEQVIVTGSRGRPRSVSDSPVPVDVFSADQLESVSYTDTNDIIKTLVPSFNVRQANSDGEEFIRPATLRGMPSDKTLVLVNSKRRHRSALVGLFATGAQAPDMSTIPAAAIKTVEVLRDGAAAQYGSDAIAGVINFLLKDNREGGSLSIDMGEFSEGDGESVTVSGNIGLPLGDNGFVSISGQFEDRDGTNRAGRYCRTAFCPVVGHPLYDTFQANGSDIRKAAAADPAFLELFNRAAANPGWDTNQRWGRPNHEANRIFVNAGLDLSGGAELYAFGSYTDGDSDKTFNYRFPYSSALVDFRLEDGSIYNHLETFPGGFTPVLAGEVTDHSLVAGLRGEWDNGLNYDFSARIGESEIQYDMSNSINASLGPASPTTFELGGLINTETQIQADFTYELDSGAVFAFGASVLDEEYELEAGEATAFGGGAWAQTDPFSLCESDAPTAAGQNVINNGSSLDCANSSDPVYRSMPLGSNGFAGRDPLFADTYTRTSTALYGDLSGNLTDNLFLQGAVRWENYDDFSSEIVWKVAGKYDVTDTFGVRASMGTSFRAPTPGQQGTSNVSTRLPNGSPILTGTFPAGSPVGAALGFDPLRPEVADNFTIGFTAELRNVDLTVDFFQTDIQDATFLGDFLDVSTDPTAGEAYDNFLALEGAGVTIAQSLQGVRAFQSAFNTTYSGVDIVASTPIDWGDAGVTSLSAAINYTKPEFDSPDSVLDEANVNRETRFDFENLNPEVRAVITAKHDVNRLTLIARLNYYGDSRDTTGRTDANGNLRQIEDFGSVVYTDLEGQYRINDNISVALGARNAFDEYPDKVNIFFEDACCGAQYSRDNGLDWQGAYYYGRLTVGF
jgi:iron complex outermembrane receptor protein